MAQALYDEIIEYEDGKFDGGTLVCETCCESDFGIVLFGRSILRILICTKLNMFQILCIFFRAMKLCSKL